MTPALRERDLAKAAALTEAVAEALRQRYVPDRLAGLAAQTGWAAFHHAALIGLGQVRMGVEMSRWQMGQAPAQVARSNCSSRTTW